MGGMSATGDAVSAAGYASRRVLGVQELLRGSGGFGVLGFGFRGVRKLYHRELLIRCESSGCEIEVARCLLILSSCRCALLAALRSFGRQAKACRATGG